VYNENNVYLSWIALDRRIAFTEKNANHQNLISYKEMLKLCCNYLLVLLLNF